MRLNSLHLVNFRQHTDTHLTFEKGLTGIIGPNGAGKSTILEAIAWALYGQDAARGKKETIRSQRAGATARVKVDLDFDLGGHRYRVSRGLNTAELYLDGADTPIANSLSGVTEVLRRRLGMSREEFFNTYFTGQKELDVMAAMGAQDRAQFLSRVLGYERLRVAQRSVKDRARVISAEATGKRSTLPDADNVDRLHAEATVRVTQTVERSRFTAARRERAQVGMADIGPRWQVAQQERELLQKALADLSVVQMETAAYTRDAERITRELGEVEAAAEELGRLAEELQPLAALSEELQLLDRLARDEGRRKTLLDNERALEEEVRKMRERRDRIATAPQREEAATLELERQRGMLEFVEGELEARRTEWVRDRQEAETKRDSLRKQYAEVKEQREKLLAVGEDGICPICERALDDHFRSVLDHFDEQLDEIQGEGRYFNSRIEQLAEMPVEVRELDERRRATFEEVGRLERALATVQSEMKDLATLTRDLLAREQRFAQVRAERETIPDAYDAVRHAAARKESERLRTLDVRSTRLATQLERRPVLESERDRVAAAIASASSRASALNARRDLLAFSEQGYTELRAKHDAAAAELRTSELDAVAAQGDASAAQSALARAEQTRDEVRRVRAELATLDKQRKLHDELDRAFTDIRTDLNKDLRPEIGEIASAFLVQLSDGRYDYLELDETYDLTLHEDGIPKPVISGGEEDIANLCLRLAISQMIADRAGQNFSLLILDEVFGSLDEARRQNVVELLRGLHDRFEQVILITHIEQVREGLDRVVSVRYDEESGSAIVSRGQPLAPEEQTVSDIVEAGV